MAMRRNGNGRGNFGNWVVAGAGIAVGAAVVSAVITGIGMLAAEGVKMLKAAQSQSAALPSGYQGQQQLYTNGTNYMP